MQERNRLVAAYVDGLDLYALYLAAPACGRPVKIGASPNPDGVFRKLNGSGETKLIFWCKNKLHARFVVDQYRDRVGRGAGDVDAGEAAALIQSIADELGIALETDETIRAQAEATILAVENELETMKRTGGLKSVNHAYRESRLRAAAEGRGAIPYPRFFNEYKVGLVRAAAELAMRTGRDVSGR